MTEKIAFGWNGLRSLRLVKKRDLHLCIRELVEETEEKNHGLSGPGALLQRRRAFNQGLGQLAVAWHQTGQEATMQAYLKKVERDIERALIQKLDERLPAEVRSRASCNAAGARAVGLHGHCSMS